MAYLPARRRAVGRSHDGGPPRRRGATLSNHGARGQRWQRGSLASRGNGLMAAPATRVLVADDDASLVQTLTWINEASSSATRTRVAGAAINPLPREASDPRCHR